MNRQCAICDRPAVRSFGYWEDGRFHNPYVCQRHLQWLRERRERLAAEKRKAKLEEEL